MSRARRGITLVELVVAMAVGGIVLALLAAISVSQQRLHADVAARLGLAEQLQQAATLLPVELRMIAIDAGDLREARDTAVEFRSTIASAVVCDTIAGGVVLAPAEGRDSTYAGFMTSINAGDTAWMLSALDSADQWSSYAIASAARVAGGACNTAGPKLSALEQLVSRVGLHLTPQPPLAPSLGAVVRVTRPSRYSLYRGGDGRWYLGAREWNAATSQFNTIQPVSGPFSSAAAHGLEFRYFDSSGAQLARPVANTRDVALIRVAIRGQSKPVMRAFSGGKASDSALAAVSMRNRR